MRNPLSFLEREREMNSQDYCSGSAKSSTYFMVHHNGIRVIMWHNNHVDNPRARVEVKHLQYPNVPPKHMIIHVSYVADLLHMEDFAILKTLKFSYISIHTSIHMFNVSALPISHFLSPLWNINLSVGVLTILQVHFFPIKSKNSSYNHNLPLQTNESPPIKTNHFPSHQFNYNYTRKMIESAEDDPNTWYQYSGVLKNLLSFYEKLSYLILSFFSIISKSMLPPSKK
jgi:hypothetical protein